MMHEKIPVPLDLDRRSGARPRNILVVEDDRTMRMFIEQQLRGIGYETVSVGDGESAQHLLSSNPAVADVILLDRTLPGISGSDVIRFCRNSPALNQKPIVLLTANSSAKDIKDGVDSGVFYYLVKPVDIAVLQAVVASAVRRADTNNKLHRLLHANRTAMSLAQSGKFTFQTPEEAHGLATLISSAFPNPERVVSGLVELLLNAVEHGNLEIGYEAKRDFVERDGLREEVERRLSDDRYKNRKVSVVLSRREDGVYVVITDEGTGFKPQPFLTLDPSRATSRTGRGIAHARVVSFDKLAYNAAGNQVVCAITSGDEFNW